MSQSSSDLPAPTGGDFILYTAPDGAVKVDVFFKNVNGSTVLDFHNSSGVQLRKVLLSLPAVRSSIP